MAHVLLALVFGARGDGSNPPNRRPAVSTERPRPVSPAGSACPLRGGAPSVTISLRLNPAEGTHHVVHAP
jgi:hypothetical protein